MPSPSSVFLVVPSLGLGQAPKLLKFPKSERRLWKEGFGNGGYKAIGSSIRKICIFNSGRKLQGFRALGLRG